MSSGILMLKTNQHSLMQRDSLNRRDSGFLCSSEIPLSPASSKSNYSITKGSEVYKSPSYENIINSVTSDFNVHAKKVYKKRKLVSKTLVSEIYTGFDVANSAEYILKTISDTRLGKRELANTIKCRNLRFVTSLHDWFIDEGSKFVMVFEPLKKFDYNCDNLMHIAKYSSQLLSAIASLHENNIIHMDVSNSNLMLDQNNNLVLIDLGFSVCKNPAKNENYSHSGGTPGFIPPEIYKNQTPSTKCDIYSSGVVIGCMMGRFITSCKLDCLGGNLLRPHDIEKIRSNLEQLIKAHNKVYPQAIIEMCRLIVLMLKEDPEERPEAETLLDYAIFNQNKLYFEKCDFENIARVNQIIDYYQQSEP